MRDNIELKWLSLSVTPRKKKKLGFDHLNYNFDTNMVLLWYLYINFNFHQQQDTGQPYVIQSRAYDYRSYS